MKNDEVIAAFLRREAAYESNLYSTGTKLISYTTCIGEYFSNTSVIINDFPYSVTTTKNVNKLKNLAFKNGYNVYILNGSIERDVTNLLDIAKRNGFKKLENIKRK